MSKLRIEVEVSSADAAAKQAFDGIAKEAENSFKRIENAGKNLRLDSYTRSLADVRRSWRELGNAAGPLREALRGATPGDVFTPLINAGGSVKRLFADIGAAASNAFTGFKAGNAVRELDALSAGLRALGPAGSAASGALAAVGEKASTLGRLFLSPVTAIAALGTAVAGVNFGAFAPAAAKAGEAVHDLSQASGQSTKDIQSLTYAFEQAGSSAQGLERITGVLNDAIAKAKENGQTSSGAFQQMGIALTDAAGNARPIKDILDDTAKKLAQMKNPADQAAAAVGLFGRRVAGEVTQLLQEGGGAIDRYGEKLKQLGAFISDDNVKKAEKFGDALQNLGLAFKGISNALGFAGIDNAIGLLDTATQKVVAFGDLVRNVLAGKPSGSPVFDFIVEAARTVYDILKDIVGGIIDVIKSIWDAVSNSGGDSSFLNWLIEGLKGALEYVRDVWGAIKEAFKFGKEVVVQAANEIAAGLSKMFGKDIKGADVIKTVLLGIAIALAGMPGAIIALIAALGQLWKAIKQALGFDKEAKKAAASFKPIQAAAQGAAAAITAPFRAIGSFFSSLWESIKAGASAVWDGIKSAASGAASLIQAAWNGVASFFQSLWDKIKSAGEAIWSGIKSAASGAAQLVEGAWSGLTQFFSTLWASIKSGASAMWEGIKSAASGAVQLIQSGWSTLTTFFSTLWTTITTAASNAGLAIQTRWQALKDFVSQIPTAIAMAWQTGLQTLVQWVDMVKAQIEEKWNALKDSVYGIATQLWQSIQQAWDASVFGQIVNAIVDAFTNGWQRIKDFVKGVVDAISNWLDGLISKAREVASGTQQVSGQSTGKARGGLIFGPGTSTSDSIPARLSRGEFVVRAAAVRKYGASLFSALNSMRLPELPGFAMGGPVLQPATVTQSFSPQAVKSGRPVTLNFADGMSITGLSGSDGAVRDLETYAMKRRLARAGRAPSWVS